MRKWAKACSILLAGIMVLGILFSTAGSIRAENEEPVSEAPADDASGETTPVGEGSDIAGDVKEDAASDTGRNADGDTEPDIVDDALEVLSINSTGYTPVQQIIVHPEITMLFDVGETEQLTAEVLPLNATYKAVVWSSSNPDAVTVDENGVITAVGKGTATITARSVDSSVTGACEVEVYISGGNVPITGLKIDPQTIEVPAGSSAQLTPQYTPSDTTENSVTWESDKPSIATVDVSGKVTGVRQGTATITAKAVTNGSIKATCKVTVLFSDVTNKNLAAYKPIYDLAARGIVKGYESYFDIDGRCTRAQFVLFLWRYAGRPAPKSTNLTFKDSAAIKALAPDYAKAIAWGQEKGIVAGFTSGANAGKFCPNDPCTRGQVVLFLWRYKGRPAASGSISFGDAAEIGKMAPDYKKAILWAVKKGITTGFSDGTFKPNQNCTRGQCVTFLYRIK